MKQRSPVSIGFETLFRRPSLGLAEVSWRWSFAATCMLLCTFSLIEYLDSLPVNSADRLLLRTRQPSLIFQAFIHIIRGSAPRLVGVLLILAVVIAVVWIALASVARAVTVKALVSNFGKSDATQNSATAAPPSSLLTLNVFRAATMLAAGIASVGTTLLIAEIALQASSALAAAFQLSQGVLMLIWMAWFVINWFLSLATLVAVVHDQDTFSAIRDTMELCIDRASSLAIASLAFGAAHFIAAIGAGLAGMFVLALAGQIPTVSLFAALILITLVYFASADFLYAGRMAAYVAIIVGPPASVPGYKVAAFDDDDRILSDLPLTPAEGY
ncbi:MAG: hypothetical protein M3O09_14630 [Acidobacteriota bacterium]|nr:hypothetical protein [Acidobacteriota bacterium]